MTKYELFYPTGSEAARSAGIGAAEMHYLLVSGKIPGAYQADNRHWRVPVEGLRSVGFEVDTQNAFHMGADHGGEDAPTGVEETPSDTLGVASYYEDPAYQRKVLRAHVEYLEEANERLMDQLQREKEERRTAERHLADLRALLDAATDPSRG